MFCLSVVFFIVNTRHGVQGSEDFHTKTLRKRSFWGQSCHRAMFQNSVVINLKRWLEFRGFPTIGNKNKTFKNGASSAWSGWSPLVGFAGTASTYMTSYTNRITVSHLLTVTMNYTLPGIKPGNVRVRLCLF